ncbi:hypothetical protein CAI21_04465 [Alkalilimnicola ehrlichii]|uniref:N-acetyltransferase domain-containing protein n=1 Tax=Alkalilimnicola ehrlichii TaxID=351052 RepID=A0A3E0X2D0_9GAMM|nr:N-acetyltransferase [Alkalilimnicola ehrlichii]RFA30767.1 hypothetical protein CAI21_04465 [Alkalilimnicola ehrlichii]RFA38343.1 hypothetical protein CAL65_05830 [Alkalilimnicola ehrlichii]
MLIRNATESDYPAICRLIHDREELFRVYPRGRYPLTVEQLAELAKQRRELRVGEVDGRVVAFANFYKFVPRRYTFIGNVIVDRDYRGQGLGQRLIKHMLKLAFAEHYLPEVRISVFTDNTAALLLYGRLGFQPYALEERQAPGGAATALLHMRIARAGRHQGWTKGDNSVIL